MGRWEPRGTSAILAEAMRVNGTFSTPLPTSEVAATARGRGLAGQRAGPGAVRGRGGGGLGHLWFLPGGSPANTALPFMSSSRKLIAGVNLPLVLEIMAMKKSGTTWEELDLDDTCKSAAQSIVLYNNFLNGGNV